MPSTLLGPLGTLARTTTVHASSLLPGKSRPRWVDMHRHTGSSLSAYTERGSRGRTEPSAVFLITGVHHGIYLAGDLLHAGRLEADGLQPGAAPSAPIGTIMYWTGMYVRNFCFWASRTVRGASTPPTSGAELEPRLVPKTRLLQLYPMLPVVATAASSDQTNLCPESCRQVHRRNFWIGSALRGAIGDFSS